MADALRASIDAAERRLGQRIDLVSNVQVGDEDAGSRDVLGRGYEYFLSQFASAEGKKGGEVDVRTMAGGPRRPALDLQLKATDDLMEARDGFRRID